MTAAAKIYLFTICFVVYPVSPGTSINPDAKLWYRKKADNPKILVLSAQALIIIRYSGLSLSKSSILFLKNDAVFIEYTDEHNIFVNVKTAYYVS